MKILVTGSNGRIGANLVRRLLGQGHEIRGFVFPGDASRAHKLDGFANVELVEGDLRDYDAVQRAVRGVDAVYHVAAAFASPHDNIEYLQINGLGTLHVLEAIRAHAPHLHRLVYACTEAVYWRTEDDGRLFERPIREDEVSHSKLMPYFLTKWIGEELCMNYHYQYGVPTVVCRFTTVLEPSELLDEEGIPQHWSLGGTRERLRAQADPAPAAREALRQLDAAWKAGKRLLISRCPDGRTFKQEWADVRDIAKGLALALDADAAVGEAFTVGGPAHRVGGSGSRPRRAPSGSATPTCACRPPTTSSSTTPRCATCSATSPITTSGARWTPRSPSAPAAKPTWCPPASATAAHRPADTQPMLFERSWGWASARRR